MKWFNRREEGQGGGDEAVQEDLIARGISADLWSEYYERRSEDTERRATEAGRWANEAWLRRFEGE